MAGTQHTFDTFFGGDTIFFNTNCLGQWTTNGEFTITRHSNEPDAQLETVDEKTHQKALSTVSDVPASKDICLEYSNEDISETSRELKSPAFDSFESLTIGPERYLSDGLPDKTLRQPYRGVIYRIFIVYRFLFSAMGLLNIVALVAVLVTRADYQWLRILTAISLAIAVTIRQDFVINALYTIFCSVPRSWPLFIRIKSAKIYHLGGIHFSAAVCSAM
jgi:hypothetical protein